MAVLYYVVLVLASQIVEQHHISQLDFLLACYLTVSITALEHDYHNIGLALAQQHIKLLTLAHCS